MGGIVWVSGRGNNWESQVPPSNSRCLECGKAEYGVGDSEGLLVSNEAGEDKRS